MGFGDFGHTINHNSDSMILKLIVDNRDLGYLFNEIILTLKLLTVSDL